MSSCTPYIISAFLFFVLPLLHGMEISEKVGQCFIVATYSSPEEALADHNSQYSEEWIDLLVAEKGVGGLLFKRKWTPEEIRGVTVRFQASSKVPLLTALDFEPGLKGHLQQAELFETQSQLGLLDEEQVRTIGQKIGKQCREMGVYLNLAPVVDICDSPDHPLFRTRSFGADPQNVVSKGKALMEGIQQEGVLACAKHFPGHGDTYQDSHLVLPLLDHSRPRLDAVELFPFREMIQAGVSCIMVAHLQVPSLDAQNPTSLSKKVIQDLLRTELGFKGLVVSDDLSMGAIQNHMGAGEACVRALLAGNDLLILSTNIEEGIAGVLQAVAEGRLSEDLIDEKLNRILAAKAFLFSADKPTIK